MRYGYSELQWSDVEMTVKAEHEEIIQATATTKRRDGETFLEDGK